MGVIKGDTGSLDYSSYVPRPHKVNSPQTSATRVSRPLSKIMSPLRTTPKPKLWTCGLGFRG